MSNPFDLEVTLDYNMNTPYKDILWKGEWVRGFAVSFTATITNRSEYMFPGTTIKVVLEEHGSLRDTDLLYTFTPVIEVPALEPETYITSSEYEYTPEFEGVCEILLESDIFKRKEITITGSMEKTPVRNRISSRFFVVRWQELEIIQLLRKIVAREDNSA